MPAGIATAPHGPLDRVLGELLALGSIRERTITRRELEAAERIYLINSVRKWRRVRLVVG